MSSDILHSIAWNEWVPWQTVGTELCKWNTQYKRYECITIWDTIEKAIHIWSSIPQQECKVTIKMNYVWGLLSAHIDPPIIVSETIKIVRIRLNTFVLQIDWKATVNSLAKLRLSNAILYRSRQHCWIEYFMSTSHCWHHERGIWRISNKTGHFCII